MLGRGIIIFLALSVALSGIATAEETLSALISEALQNNKEIEMAYSRASSARYRPPQEASLPEPMFMIGYQNEGYKKYTYGEMPDSQWMFSASQMFPYPGKREIKKAMSQREAESLGESLESVKASVVREVKELYYELFLAYKAVELIDSKRALYLGIENAASSRYLSGMAPLEEVIMAQTEKYMLDEKKEMFSQKIASISAMLRRALGRDMTRPIEKPREPIDEEIAPIEEIIKTALEGSPEIRAKRKMLEAKNKALEMAKREYYPDFTITGLVSKRGGDFEDMWSLSASLNLPVFYKTRQRNSVLEAQEAIKEAKAEVEATELNITSSIGESYSMAVSAERLMRLYKEGLIPKTRQGYEAALAGYTAGKVEINSLLKSLSLLIDYELSYWGQFVEKKKALARIDSLRGRLE